MKSALSKIVSEIALLQRPETALYSEASFQLSLGIELFKRFGITARMEMKIPNTGEYLDVYYVRRRKRIGIELKYKTTSTEDLGFDYLHQGAQNNGRFDVLHDVQRLESFKRAGVIDQGFGIFVTNDPYYLSSIRAATAVAPFELSEGRIIPNKLQARWAGRTGAINLSGTHMVKWLAPKRLPAAGEASFRALIFEV
jgi:hypothetical protein